ncbi:MAG: type VI secretion system tube protein Hcp [Acidobacteria bacterium]|nr:type VI secretion system tube protein Hcp [Acidobacteriota bacterium]
MAVDYFLKIDGIPGESADYKHKEEIDVLSWSWGESQSGTMSAGGGGGAGKVNMQDFHFVMKVNKATPKLILACASGEHIKKAVLTCRKAGKEQQEFLKYTFSDVLISSYQTGGSSSGDEIPMEQVSFNYAKMETEYKAQKLDGSLDGGIKAGWDLKANKLV